MTTSVVHCMKVTAGKYIGRPGILGNPFLIGKDGTREEVIIKYENYARERIRTDPIFAAEVKSCKGQILRCWCAPKPCHGDVLAQIVEEE